MVEEEQQFHLQDYFRVIKKRRWMIFCITFMLVVAALIYTLRQIPVYRATTSILIEKEAPNVVSFEEVVNSDADKLHYQTQAKILKSRPLAKLVINKLNLASFSPQGSSGTIQKSPKSIVGTIRQLFRDGQTGIQKWLGVPEEAPMTEITRAAQTEERLLKEFLSKITVNQIETSRLLNISVNSTDRMQCVQIANTLVETYIEQQLEIKLAATKNATRWLFKEVEAAKQKVTESEFALQKYKEDNEILSFKDRQAIVMQKLSEISSSVNQAKIERLKLESQYQHVQSFRKGELETVPEIIHDSLIRQLKIKLLNLDSERSELLKKFRSKHPTVTAIDSQIAAVQQQLDTEIQQVVTSIRNQYELALLQENDLLKALEQQKVEAQELNQQSVRYSILQREFESNQRIYETLLQRANEASLTERLETSNVQIVEPAAIPTFPISPNKKRTLLLALMIGLVIGMAVAFFLEYLDQSFQTPEDIKRYLEIPFLGIIPKISTKDIAPHESEEALSTIVATITVVDARSNIAESYRSLRTNISFSSLESRSLLLVTSSVPGEGKSSITANLGISMAQSGRKTLIIDCDLRKPMMKEFFRVENPDYGFSDLLLVYEDGNGHHAQMVIQKTSIENLDLIPCGTIPPNPSEILSQTKTGQILAALKKDYDFVLIDSPPVNVVTDPVILSQVVDGVILVIGSGKVSRAASQRARDQLLEVHTTILGGVLNNVDIRKDNYYYQRYYGYKYHKYYYNEEKPYHERSETR